MAGQNQLWRGHQGGARGTNSIRKVNGEAEMAPASIRPVRWKESETVGESGTHQHFELWGKIPAPPAHALKLVDVIYHFRI